ncbi:MAG: hypothetical protein RXO23_02210 [Vulcanisaeta sp.]
MTGQSMRRYGIVIIIGALALLGIVLAVVLNLWTPTKIYGSLVPVQSFEVVANFSDGSIPPSLMYKMINNTYESALKGFVTLEQPPYPVVNVKLLSNTLVTFKLPSGFRYEYASIVIHDNRIYVYEFNNAQDYRLYTVVSMPIASVTVKIIYPETKVGNTTLVPVGTFIIEKFNVPLPGTSDPSVWVYFESYSAVWYIGSQVAANTTAAGWFYIVPYQEVNSIIVDGSAYPGFGYALCTSNAPGQTQGVGSYAAQTYVWAGYAFYDCPVTVVLSNWPWVGMDAAGNVYYPTSFPGSKSIEAACICTGASFTFELPPPEG